MNKKILIIKTSALGDIIHTYPVIAYLKEHLPEVIIDWVVESSASQLISKHPHIDRTLEVQTRDWRKSLFSTPTRNALCAFRKRLREREYDVIFDLQGNIKSAMITKIAKGKNKVGFGYKTVAEFPNIFATNIRFNPPKGLNIREDYLYLVKSYFRDSKPYVDKGISLNLLEGEKEQIQGILKTFGNKKVVLVCAGSMWKNKRIPIETLIKSLQTFPSEYSFLICWGSEREEIAALRLHFNFPSRSIVLPKLPLHLLQNLMAEVDLVYSMDSLPLHLAATTSTPTFSLFGPSSSDKYRPLGNQHLSIQGECPYGQKFNKRCPNLRKCTTGACLRTLKFNEINTILKLLLSNIS